VHKVSILLGIVLPISTQARIIHRYADDHSKGASSGTDTALHYLVTSLGVGCIWLNVGIYS